MVLAFHDPNDAGSYPTCPFLSITGFDCPGCGTLRAVHALLHGDVAGAIGFNLLLMVVLIGSVIAGASARIAPLSATQRAAVSRAVRNSLPLVVVAFWVLRNTSLPIVEGLGA